jgi:succinyl-CoA synthetase beta subunit
LLLDYSYARKLMDRYGIRSVESRYVASASEAVKFANDDPIVMKVLSQKALHKSKSGLVELDLSAEKDITNAYNRLVTKARRLKPYRIVAQRMVKNGIEIIIGGKVDAQFGKLILLGLGGIYVETFKDFSLRVCPITPYDAQAMINQLKSRHVIAPDEKSNAMIKSLLLKASKMFMENDVSEIDLNPIILHDGTYDAVDLRLLK